MLLVMKRSDGLRFAGLIASGRLRVGVAAADFVR